MDKSEAGERNDSDLQDYVKLAEDMEHAVTVFVASKEKESKLHFSMSAFFHGRGLDDVRN